LNLASAYGTSSQALFEEQIPYLSESAHARGYKNLPPPVELTNEDLASLVEYVLLFHSHSSLFSYHRPKMQEILS